MSHSYDLTILGGGPGGYVAAIRAAQLGLSVALIDRGPGLGGTCLHRGCIPTKALLHYTETLERLAHCADYGITVSAPQVDLSKMHAAKGTLIRRMAAGIDGLMKKNGVTVLSGHGRLVGERQVEVGDQRIASRHVLLATGSVPATLPFLPPDGQQVFTSDEILTLEQLPQSLVVLGAGAVGLEFACIYRSLGSQVQVIEMADRPLPLEDREVSQEVLAAYQRRGIPIHVGVRLEHAERRPGQVELTGQRLATGEAVRWTADAVLCAVGRRPRLDDVGLEAWNLPREGPYLKVSPTYQTELDWLWAVGDIVPGPQLAHVASAEALVCVETIANHPTRPLDYTKIPSATYCRPEVASIGHTEDQARALGYEVKVGRFPWSALGKAAVIGETEGFVKVVSEARYGELLGVHIVGPHATDLIAEACVAIACEATVEELFRTVHAHPTLPEGLMEAAHGVFSQPIHLPPSRRRSASKA